MSVFSGVVGEVSKRVTSKGDVVDPLFLSYCASWFSVSIGILMFIYGMVSMLS